MPTLGSRVKQLREGLGLSQFELAKLSSITQASLSRLEANKMSQLKSEKLKSLALALRVSVDYLLGENETQKVEDVIAHDEDARDIVVSYSQMSAEQRKQLRDFAMFLNKK